MFFFFARDEKGKSFQQQFLKKVLLKHKCENIEYFSNILFNTFLELGLEHSETLLPNSTFLERLRILKNSFQMPLREISFQVFVVILKFPHFISTLRRSLCENLNNFIFEKHFLVYPWTERCKVECKALKV